MVYTERKNLAIIALQEKQNYLSYDELFHVLLERPSLAVYVEVKGFLYGIVTMGQIYRSYLNKKQQIEINTGFTFLHTEESMKARKLFSENERMLHVLPVVSSDGRLLGNYTEWDDPLFVEYSSCLLEKTDTSEITRQKFHLALVKPNECFKKNLQSFQAWKNILETKGISLKVINFQQALDYVNKVDYLLFPGEIEKRTFDTIYTCLSNTSDYKAVLCTYREFIFFMDGAEGILKALQKKGVVVLTFNFEESESAGYLKRLSQAIEDNYRQYGLQPSSKLLPQTRPEFLEEFYEKYEEQLLPFPFSVCLQNNIFKLRDTDNPLFHIHNGDRQTVEQPQKYERSIYIFGPCPTLSLYTDDAHTVPSLLQKILNCTESSYRVINSGVPPLRNAQRDLWLGRLLGTSFRQGDIVLFDKLNIKISGIQNLDLTNALEQYHVPATWFADCVRHCNHKANQVLAEIFYNNLIPILQQPVEGKQIVKQDSDLIKLYLHRYFLNFSPSIYQTIGSIVMNCNPFTFGHRYLIEEALKQVDFLIIFVVEENASLFTFEERFSMVCAGTSDLNNVMVVPSGEFILSKMTFPEYFIKETDEELIENTENDITLFAEKIAPQLHITHRFVGEELEDKVTAAYNQAMKRILPAYKIQLVEIPRKQNGQVAISASRVRKCLEESNLGQLQQLVPDSTKKILFYTNE